MQGLSGTIFDGKEISGTVYIDQAGSRLWDAPVSASLPLNNKVLVSNKEPYFKRNFPGIPGKRNLLRTLILYLSTGFVAASVFGLLFLFWPVLVDEVRYDLILSHQGAAEEKKTAGFPNGDLYSPPNTTFSIVVPKIDAKAPIVSNIDAADEKAYMEALKIGVAQAKGTCFPGMDCIMYLFAHSAGSPISAARYNAVFYLLRKLETGDSVIVYYYGKKFLYEVTGKEIVSPSDTHYITDTGETEGLILQTCDPPGTSINRLLVFAKPKLVEYLK